MQLKNGQYHHLQFFSREIILIYQRYSLFHLHRYQPLHKSLANAYKSYSYSNPQPLKLLTFSLVHHSPPPYLDH